MSRARPRGEGKRRDLPRRLGRLLLASALAALWGVFVGRLMTLAGVAFLGYGYLGSAGLWGCAAYGACYGPWVLLRLRAPGLLRDILIGAAGFLLFWYFVVEPVWAACIGMLGELPGLWVEGLSSPGALREILYHLAEGGLTALGARSAANWVREVTSPEPEPTSTGMTRREDGTWDLD